MTTEELEVRESMGRKERSIIIRDQWDCGSTSRRMGKRYLAQVRDSENRRYLSKAWPTVKKARQWARAKLAEFTLQLDSSQRAMWSTIGKDFITSLEEMKRSDSHIAEVTRVVKGITDAGAKDMKSPGFQGIVRKWIQEGKSFAVNRVNHPTVSNYVKRRWMQQIRSVVKHAMRRRLLNFDPLQAIRAINVDSKEKATFTLAELHELVSEKHANDSCFLPFCLLIYTGCRLNEALNLRWEDVDYETRTIKVRIQPTYKIKRRKERTVPLPGELIDILKPIGQLHGFIIADSKMREAHHKTQWNMFKKYLGRCGVMAGDRSPHSTRHTWVSLMLAVDYNAFQVAEWAGHNSLTTTQGYSLAQSTYRRGVKKSLSGEFILRELGSHGEPVAKKVD